MDPETKSKHACTANAEKLPEVTAAREDTETKKEEGAKDPMSQEKKDQLKLEQRMDELKARTLEHSENATPIFF